MSTLTVIIGGVVGLGGGLAAPAIAARFDATVARAGRAALIVAGGAVGAALGARLQPTGAAGWLVAVACLATAAAAPALVLVDLRVRRLPDAIVGPLAALVAGLLGAAALTAALAHAPWVPAGRALLAAAVTGIGFTALAILPRSALGFGDVKLGTVLAGPLGWYGWGPLLTGVVCAYVLGGLAALALLATGRAGRHTELPFGPALLLGAFTALTFPDLF